MNFISNRKVHVSTTAEILRGAKNEAKILLKNGTWKHQKPLDIVQRSCCTMEVMRGFSQLFDLRKKGRKSSCHLASKSLVIFVLVFICDWAHFSFGVKQQVLFLRIVRMCTIKALKCIYLSFLVCDTLYLGVTIYCVWGSLSYHYEVCHSNDFWSWRHFYKSMPFTACRPFLWSHWLDASTDSGVLIFKVFRLKNLGQF